MKTMAIWRYEVGFGKSCEDKEAFKSRHGAIMPWQLAYDLIRSYSRPGQLGFGRMRRYGNNRCGGFDVRSSVSALRAVG